MGWLNCHLLSSKGRREEYKTAKLAEHICSKVGNSCQNGWPDKHSIGPDLRLRQECGKFTIHNNLHLYDRRIVVPKGNTPQDPCMKVTRWVSQNETRPFRVGPELDPAIRSPLRCLILQRCRMRAQHSVWWPGISKQVTEMVDRCEVCAKQLKQRSEPLILVELPDRPWQKIATDLFTLQWENNSFF